VRVATRIPGNPSSEAPKGAAAVWYAVGSPVRTQSAGDSPTPFDSRHYSAAYSVVPIRNTTVWAPADVADAALELVKGRVAGTIRKDLLVLLRRLHRRVVSAASWCS
jgi:hypothetical protein